MDETGYLTQLLANAFHQLSDQDAQVRAIVDYAAEGIIVVDSAGHIGTFNHAAERLFGYTAQEIQGRSIVTLLPATLNENSVPNVLNDRQEVDGIHKVGNKVPVSLRINQMVLSGQVMFTFLVADISERKLAELKTFEAESRYRHLVETAHDLVWSMDLQGRWTYLNNASKLIYGYEPHEMLGQPLSKYQVSEYTNQDKSVFKEIIEGKELVQYETAHLDRNGSVHHLSFNAKTIKGADNKVIGISGTARDITKQKSFDGISILLFNAITAFETVLS